MKINDSKDIMKYCKEKNTSLYEIAIEYEMDFSSKTKEEIIQKMSEYLEIMQNSIKEGLKKELNGKIIKASSKKLNEFVDKNKMASGDSIMKAIAYAMGVMEVNVTMGKIIAAPTAGASGVLPGVLLSLKETFKLDDEKLVEGLLVAGLTGYIISNKMAIAGAKGGCQAEVGVASSMAVVAGLYMLGIDIESCFNGAAIALKNLMGLICDPVCGLVEVPCQKRNAIGVSNALTTIDMVRGGLRSYIPFDEVVDAMRIVGDMMPIAHKETGLGGIATTPTGIEYKKCLD